MIPDLLNDTFLSISLRLDKLITSREKLLNDAESWEAWNEAHKAQGSYSKSSNHNKFIGSRDALPEDLKAFVTPYSSEEYNKMNAQVYLSPSGKSGFALKPDGDIISVFSEPGAHEGRDAIKAAIAAGGKKLDCIGSHLKDVYAGHGFEVADTLKWDDKYAPKNWNYEKFGRPDIYLMELKK
jgi:hypothetical protein